MILCIKYDYEMPRNLKLLYLYEMLLGLKINFVKSEVLMRNDNNNNLVKYANLFDCKIGTFPIKCLGVPVNPSKLHICDWGQVYDNFAKKLDIGNAVHCLWLVVVLLSTLF